MSFAASEGCYHAAMSKSVTVIKGAVWRQRSVTWNRNVKSEPMQRAKPGGDGPGDGPGLARSVAEASAGGPDEESSWDSVYEGRDFRRRERTG